MKTDDELFILYKKVNDLEKQLQDERDEHKEIYRNMRKNLFQVYEKNYDKSTDFEIFHLKEEIKRLKQENYELRKK
jgi:hypothetical protein